MKVASPLRESLDPRIQGLKVLGPCVSRDRTSIASVADPESVIGANCPGSQSRDFHRNAFWISLFLATYLALDRLSYVEALRPFAIMAWNPALGVCVAVASRWGKKALPIVFIAPLLSALLFRGFPLTPLYPAYVGILAVTKVLSITVIGKRLSAARRESSVLQSTQAGLLIAAIPVTLVVCVVHAASLATLGLLRPDQIHGSVERLWIGDLIGIFVQTPFCFLIFDLVRTREQITLRAATEAAAQFVATTAAGWTIFVIHKQTADAYFYILFIPMIWIVLTHGINGAIALNLGVQAMTIAYLLWINSTHADLTLFQALAVVFIASSLALGFAVEQSRVATERLRIREQELAAWLKIAETSELAGALAHELSHPIGAISNYAAVVGDRLSGSDPETRAIFAKLRQEAKRAMDTVHRLREFFRSGSMVMERIELEELVRDAISLLKSLIGQTAVSIRATFDLESVAVLGDRVQLHAVLRNLLVNALDAINARPPDQRNIQVTILKTVDFAHIVVEDSGLGIPAEVGDQIFEPLVTTKRDGLGLGLSTSRSIIQSHGGKIEISESDLGGAKFVITLPLDRS